MLTGLPGLKHARMATGITQKELASKCGLSEQFISFLECGRCNASAQVMLRLAEELKVSVDSLLRDVPVVEDVAS